MIWLRNFGWAALAIVTLAAAVVPDAVTLPEPDGAIVLDGAIYLPDHGDASQVSLPYAVYPPHGEDARLGRFVIGFDLTALPHEPFFIFIPSLNRRASLIANGETLFGFEASSIWTGPLVSTPLMVLLPHMALKAGRNELMLVVEAGPFAVPTYLSKIYLGGESALAPAFKLRSFLDVQLKIMAIAAHILLGLGLIFAYFFRPKDPLFFWLAVLNVVTAVVAIEAFCGYQPALRGTLPFIIAISPAMGVVFVSVAMSLINLRPPKMMGVTAITIPCLLLPLAVIDSTLTKMIVAVITIAVLTAGYAAATGLLAWGAIRQHSIDARMMLAPTLLITWYAMRDVYITVTLPHNGFYLLTTYPRPLYLAFITAVLMRRMGVSLDQVDRANETLNIKLDEREAELAVLSRKERIEAAHLIRDQERQRLTHDLHDGISGHLASIIALSERAGDKLIEQAAREALNDLRLVIYSLDLGDRELFVKSCLCASEPTKPPIRVERIGDKGRPKRKCQYAKDHVDTFVCHNSSSRYNPKTS